MLEINKFLQNKIEKDSKLLNFNLGDHIKIKYYSKISGIQIRKFSGICISIKRNNNKNNILITLMNNENKEFLIFKFYLHWNQILSLEILNKNILNLKKSKLYHLK